MERRKINRTGSLIMFEWLYLSRVIYSRPSAACGKDKWQGHPLLQSCSLGIPLLAAQCNPKGCTELQAFDMHYLSPVLLPFIPATGIGDAVAAAVKLDDDLSFAPLPQNRESE